MIGRLNRLSQLAVTTLVVILVVCAAMMALLSLRWPLINDLPLMLYEGFLISEHGVMPYRDFFDMNPPGTVLLYTVVHLVTQGGDVILRVLDIAILLAISGCFAVVLHKHGWQAIALASSSYALLYMAQGPNQSLQREVFCVLFAAISYALVWEQHDVKQLRWRTFVAGVLAGIATSVKPPALALWFPLVIMVYLLRFPQGKIFSRESWQAFYATSLSFGLGFLIVLVLIFVWLWANDALDAYMGMFRHYYPLYTELDKDGLVVEPTNFMLLARYVLNPAFMLVTHPGASILVFLGVLNVFAIKESPKRQRSLLWLLLLLMTLAYIAVSGKFWIYHGIPFYFAMSMGMGHATRITVDFKHKWLLSLVALIALVSFLPAGALKDEMILWLDGEYHLVNEGVVDEITDWVAANVDEQASIMPIDVVDGAVQTLYRLRRPLHGYFVYDLHFYHHVDDPYIQSLRQIMVEGMENDPPDAIIMYESWRPHGVGCAEDFPALDTILADEYTEVFVAGNGAVLCRNENIQGDRCAASP